MQEIKMVKLTTLKKNPNNPRIVKDDGFKKLKESLSGARGLDHFYARPCIVSTRTGEHIIIAGNTRFQAAIDLGWKEVPAVVLDGLTEEQEKEIIIRDNVQNGEWDWEILANEWESVQLNEWGCNVPAWLTQDIDDINIDPINADDQRKTDNGNITFEFTVEDGEQVTNALKKINNSKEKALWFLIFGENE